MRNELRGIALLLLALVCAVIGQTADEILCVISLAIGLVGIAVTFWDSITALWHRLTAEPTGTEDKE